MLHLVRNLLTLSLIKGINLYILKFKRFIRFTYRKFSIGFSKIHFIIRQPLLAIASVSFAFIALRFLLWVWKTPPPFLVDKIFLVILREIILTPLTTVFIILVSVFLVSYYLYSIASLSVSWLTAQVLRFYLVVPRSALTPSSYNTSTLQYCYNTYINFYWGETWGNCNFGPNFKRTRSLHARLYKKFFNAHMKLPVSGSSVYLSSSLPHERSCSVLTIINVYVY